MQFPAGNRLHRLGNSISYNCVSELENCLVSSVCTRFEQDGVVCPSQLRKDLFTVGAFDNIDHNLSSTTAQGSFHGTRISIFQSALQVIVECVQTPLLSDGENTQCALRLLIAMCMAVLAINCYYYM